MKKHLIKQNSNNLIPQKFSMKYIIIFQLLIYSIAYSQFWKRIDSIFTPNEIQAISFSSPFFCDLDGDGDLDLFLGSSALNNILFFRNVGNKFEPRFARDDKLLQEVNEKEYNNSPSYPVLVDLDGDEDYDLIISTFKGLQYYRNVGDKTFPNFFKIENFFFDVNRLIGNDAKPAFVDIDKDGDYDLFVGIGESLFGGPRAGTILGFRNKGKKHYPKFAFDKILTNGIKDLGLNAFPTFVDLNNDKKIELLVGRDVNTFAYFVNQSRRKNPFWVRSNFNFNIETNSYWKNPTFADIDGDGDYDLIYGSADGELYFYRNIGSPKRPSFRLEQGIFEPIRITGGAPSVSFADFDKDGDFDLLSGDWLGGFQYFQNVGSKYRPIFRKFRASFSNLKAGSYSTPIFVDINNDGKLDIISGSLDGKVYCFLYNGKGFVESHSLFRRFSMRDKSAIAAADLNNDGLIDLLICGGTPDQYLLLYNKGNNNFVVDNSLIQNVSLLFDSRPTFADIDNDGDFDLIIGSRDGRLIYYENTGTPEKPQFELNRDLFKNIKVKQNSSPGFADLNGDGSLELVIGEYTGNFYYYEPQFPVNLVNFFVRSKENSFDESEVINPFAKIQTIKFKISKAREIINPFKPEFVLVNLYDLQGNYLKTLFTGSLRPGFHEINIDLDEFASSNSVYLYTVQITNGEFYSGRIFVLK